MKTKCLGLVSICVLLVSAGCALAQAPGPQVAFPPQPGPVPPAILSARTFFLANGGADGGLFPSPFSGDPNRGYDEFFAGLTRMGYQLVADPSQADLVLELRLIAPYGPTNANKPHGAADPLPSFRLKIYDRRSHYLVWALTESVEMAILQKTHDRNFDEAISALLMDFKTLTRPQTATATQESSGPVQPKR